ncbi:hypothetical protein [Rhodoligotrophos ferricapiens]|uniref:hypothetical protein n=1 Tax=Rhodoligotrophos ferricapiens TaxID=3069264 RepID=UPI00315CCD10
MKRFYLPISLAALFQWSSSVMAADLGPAPELPVYTPPPSTIYFTAGGGYQYLMGEKIYGIFDAPTSTNHWFPKDQDGWFGNVAIGWKSGDPNAAIGQAELYGRVHDTSKTENWSGGTLLMDVRHHGVPAGTNVPQATDSKLTHAEADRDHRLIEVGARFKSAAPGVAGFAFGLEPFAANFTQDYLTTAWGPGVGNQTGANAPRSAFRSAEIDAWIGGASVSAEASMPLHDSAYALVRASAGVYGVSAQGRYAFSSIPAGVAANAPATQTAFADSRSGIGGRFGGEIRLVQQLAPGINIAAVAGADYWTKLPGAIMTVGNNSGPDTRTGWNDLILVNAGLELTFEFGS